MSEHYEAKSTPMRATDVPQTWIEERRAILLRDGHAIRTGAGYWIEVQSINEPHTWHPIHTPNGGFLYDSAGSRDAVLHRLWGALS